MNKNTILKSLATVLIASALVGGIVLAGTLNPSGAPAASLKTLNDIYLRLTAGTAADSHTLSPTSTPDSTMYTLEEIYTAIPGQGSNVSGTNGQLEMTIPDGIYSDSKTCTAADTNLVLGNIKDGTTIFGVTGNYTGAVVPTLNLSVTGVAGAVTITGGFKGTISGSLLDPMAFGSSLAIDGQTVTSATVDLYDATSLSVQNNLVPMALNATWSGTAQNGAVDVDGTELSSLTVNMGSAGGFNFSAIDCGLSTAQVDALIIAALARSTMGGTLYLTGASNGAVSEARYADIDTLRDPMGLSWTVTVNGY